jgi:hypothetical protein
VRRVLNHWRVQAVHCNDINNNVNRADLF